RPMRPRLLAAVSLAAAVVGGVAVLLIACGAGWLDGDRRTVVVESPPVVEASSAAVRPLLGGSFDPAKIYAQRSAGVVTIYSVFGSVAGASASQGSGFVVTDDGVILTN